MLLVLCVFLLPSRRARLRLAPVFANPLGALILRILGIRLEVAHRERIDAHRPAIFVFNHASELDAIVSMALWPPYACGIGKIEQARIPLWGQVYGLAGNLFIDRSDRERAIATMNEAVDIIQRIGMSPWIAPEGTRSLDGTLGPFKKGFVHLAVASGLPLVPIVLHDAHALWPTKTRTITPGTVRVTILPPIDTSAWSTDTVDEHVAATRQVFVDALG